MKKIYTEIEEDKVRELIQDGVVNDGVQLAFRNSEEEDWREHNLWYVVLTTAKEPAKKYETEAGSFSCCAIVENEESQDDNNEDGNSNQCLPDHIYEVRIHYRDDFCISFDTTSRFYNKYDAKKYANSIESRNIEFINFQRVKVIR